jgi:hypothetical protein
MKNLLVYEQETDENSKKEQIFNTIYDDLLIREDFDSEISEQDVK